MPGSDNAVVLLNGNQRPLYETLLSAYVENILVQHLRNSRTKNRATIYLPLRNQVIASSYHLLGFKSLAEVKAWIDTQYICKHMYESRGFHLEVHKVIIGEDDQDNSPLAIDAIYLVRDGHSGDWPDDNVPSMFSST